MSRVPTPLSASTRLSPTPRPSICCWLTGTAPAHRRHHHRLLGRKRRSRLLKRHADVFLRRCRGARRLGKRPCRRTESPLSQGRPVSFLDDKLDPNQNFYVLGISPNAARLSVRFFLHSDFGQFAKICRTTPTGSKSPALPSTSGKTCRSGRWRRRRSTRDPGQNPSPQLVGDLLRHPHRRAVPRHLLNGVTLRIRAERGSHQGRAAILKAYYLRNYPTELNKEVFTVSLNESSNVPYVLGRLFSVLETIQSVANPGINATIKDRYFNSACATPGNGLPHAGQAGSEASAEDEHPNEVHFSKQLTELLAQLPETGFPARLSLPGAGCL